MSATAPPVLNSLDTCGSIGNTRPRSPCLSAQMTRPPGPHTLRCTMDSSWRRWRITAVNASRSCCLPAVTPGLTNGPPTTRANVIPRVFACLRAASCATCRVTTMVAPATTTRASKVPATNRRSARRAAVRGEGSGSADAVDMDEPVTHRDGHSLELRVGAELGEQTLHVPTAGVQRDADLLRDHACLQAGGQHLQDLLLALGQWRPPRCGDLGAADQPPQQLR